MPQWARTALAKVAASRLAGLEIITTFVRSFAAALGFGLDHRDHRQAVESDFVGIAAVREQLVDIVIDMVAAHPGFTHQRSKVEHYAKSGNFRASLALTQAPISKPRCVVIRWALASVRFDA
jgi:hypothetical protein